MSELTLIQMREQRTLFLDKRNEKTYYINNLFSEQKVNHIRVIYLVSTDGKHKQQFSDYYFFYLLYVNQIKQL